MPRRMAAYFVCFMSVLPASHAPAAPPPVSTSHAAGTNPRSGPERGDGVHGLTILRAHIAYSAPTGEFSTVAHSGPGLGASIGYGVSRWTLVSFGVAHHRFDRSGGSSYRYSITPITVDLDFVVPSRARVQPRLGVGVGFYTVNQSRSGVQTEQRRRGSDIGLHLGTGLDAAISPRTRVGASLKYHQAWSASFSDSPFYTIQMEMGFTL